MCAKIAYGFWKKRSIVSSVCSLSCEKSERNEDDKLKREKPKTVRTPENIAAVAASVCEAPSTSIHRPSRKWTFRRYHWDKFCIKNLVWRHTKFNWFRSWNQLTIQSVFASLSGPVIDLQKMPILAKKIIFSDEAHFDLGGYRKPARTHWKADSPKTSHCLVRILVHRHNWAIFLRKWARWGRYSQCQSSQRQLTL